MYVPPRIDVDDKFRVQNKISESLMSGWVQNIDEVPVVYSEDRENTNIRIAEVPKFVIELDRTPPRERWIPVVSAFKDYLPAFKKEMEEMKKDDFGTIVSFFARGIIGQIVVPEELKLEMEGIASITKVYGLDYYDILMCNVCYSLEAGCTSAVRSGFHIRTMDWEMESLRALTCDIEFRKGGKPIFIATTWALFVGVLTGMRIGDWSVSLNYRKISSSTIFKYLQNSLVGFLGNIPIEFLIRNLLQNESDVEQVIESLQTGKVMSPCYLILSTVSKKNKNNTKSTGWIITRDRTSHIMDQLVKDEYIVVQTNHDHWVKREGKDLYDWADGDSLLESSYDRGRSAHTFLSRKVGIKDPKKMMETCMEFITNTAPVYNEDTVYSVVMNPGLGLYDSRRLLRFPITNMEDEGESSSSSVRE